MGVLNTAIVAPSGGGGGAPTDAQLGSGSADATTYLRGDRTWAAVTAGMADPFPAPASPSQYDDEFTSLAGWTLGANCVTGTIDWTGSPTNQHVFDINARPSHVLWYGHSGSGLAGRGISKTISLTTNCVIAAKVYGGERNAYTNEIGAQFTGAAALAADEGTMGFSLTNSGEEGVGIYWHRTNAATWTMRAYAKNNSGYSFGYWANFSPGYEDLVFAFVKTGDLYNYFLLNSRGHYELLGWFTKTGDTTIVKATFASNCGSNARPLVWGADWFRIYENTTDLAVLYRGA